MEKKVNQVLYYICKYCRQRFLDMPSLTTHKRENHLHEILNRSRRVDIPAEELVDTKVFSEPAPAATSTETTMSILSKHQSPQEPGLDTKAKTNNGIVPCGSLSPSHVVQQLKCKYCPKQVGDLSELLSHQLVHERAFRCQKCLISFGSFPLLNAHIKSGCPGRRSPSPPPPAPPPVPKPPSEILPPVANTANDDFNFTMPVISRSIYDEFYVPSDESSISSDSSEEDEPVSMDVLPKTKEKDMTCKYSCKFCGKGWNFLSQTKQHERTHTKPHQCQQCSARFAEFYLLRNHVVKSHGSDNRGRAQTSKFKKKNKNKLKISLESPSPLPEIVQKPPAVIPVVPNSPNKIKCPECPRFLKTNENLKVHMRIHNGIRPYACKLCPYTGAQIGQLNYHMKCHTEKHEHQCDLCSASYRHEPHLKRHVKQVHERSEAKLGQNSTAHALGAVILNNKREEVSLVASPKKSPEAETTYTCTTCSKEFTSPNLLASHESFHLDEKQFTCRMCEVGFTRKSDLLRHNKSQNHLTAVDVFSRNQHSQHISSTSPQSSIKIQIPASASLKSKMSQIDPLSNSSALELEKETEIQDPPQSQNQTHPSPGKKKLKCLLCACIFTTQIALANHVKTHRGEDGKFQCNICHKYVTTSASLKTHMRQHSGEKPYSCIHCGKNFMYQTSFKRHVQSHGGRAFKCTECTSTFVLKSDLKRHFYRVHVFNEKDKEKTDLSHAVAEVESIIGDEDEDNSPYNYENELVKLPDSDSSMSSSWDQ